MSCPLDWVADKEYLKNTLSNQKYSALENILLEASTDLYEDSLFLSQEDSKVVIKPDPLADFFRSNSFENPKMQLNLRQLIQHMPYRITYNIVLATRFEEEIREDVAKLIVLIWEELNSKTGYNPEYIFALYFFVGHLFGIHTLQLSYTEWKKSKVNKWLVAFEQIYDNYPEYNLKLGMAATLHNTCNFCGMHGYLEQMEEALKGLGQFYRKYPEPVFCVMLGMSLRNVTKPYSESKLFKKVEECLDELREIYESHPKELHTVMADALLNAYVGRKNHDLTIRPKILDEYLMEIRQLYQKYQEGDSAERLAAVLFNASLEYEIVNPELNVLLEMSTCIGFHLLLVISLVIHIYSMLFSYRSCKYYK